MSYCIGFIFGVCQGYGKDEGFAAEVIIHFGELYEKTNENYFNTMDKNLLPNRADERSFLELFAERWLEKTFKTDRDASTAFISGMAEGKDYADISKEAEKNTPFSKTLKQYQNLI